MILPGSAVRKAFYDLLDGNLNYQANIPVYDEKVPTDATPGNFYVILASQTENNSSNKHRFVHNVTINIDVVTKFIKDVRKLPAEAIASQITTLLQPTPSTTGLTDTTEFEFRVIRYLDTQTLSDEFSSVQVMRKIIRYSLTVIQVAGVFLVGIENKLVYDVKYIATGAEGFTLSVPEIVGKMVLLITREFVPLYEVAASPDTLEYIWNDVVLVMGQLVDPGERFNILYRDY